MSDAYIVLPEAPGDPALKRAQSLVGTSAGRPDHDFYPSPPEATEALLRVERFQGSVWECACGDGAIVKVLERHGYADVLATDLVHRGFGEAPHDFLTSPLSADNIITNPPFTLAQAFVEQALRKATSKVAILGKLAFLEGAKRKTLFEVTPLARVYVFSKRLTMTRNGLPMANGGMIAFAWYVWQHGHQGAPTLHWL